MNQLLLSDWLACSALCTLLTQTMVVLILWFGPIQMRSTLLPGQPWDVMVDLFFYREPEETKEPGEEDAADYNNQEGYGQLPAPGG